MYEGREKIVLAEVLWLRLCSSCSNPPHAIGFQSCQDINFQNLWSGRVDGGLHLVLTGYIRPGSRSHFPITAFMILMVTQGVVTLVSWCFVSWEMWLWLWMANRKGWERIRPRYYGGDQ